MNRATTKILAALLIIITAHACATDGTTTQKSTTVKSYKDLVYPPIKTDIPKPARVTLSNGMKVLLMPDHELPLINVSAMIRVGSVWEPEEKTGLAAMTGAAIRAGGTKTFAPDKLDEILENIAASVEVGIGEESGSGGLSVLTKDWDQGLKVFADVIRNPRFDKDRFELLRAQTLDAIRRQNDVPSQIGMRELKKLIYKNSPYGSTPTIKTVSAITIADAKAFHRRYFVPQSIILGVTGDFNEASIVANLEKAFGGWNGPNTAFPKVVTKENLSPTKIYLADKKTPQAVIRVGHVVDITRKNPDYYAVRVMNGILGGNGFASRLTKAIRTDRGLAYSTWSYVIAGRLGMGRFISGAETKTATSAEVISIIFDETKKIVENKVSDRELKLSKNSLVNSFVFIFDKPSRIMGEWLTAEYYGLPENYLIEYRDRVMDVTTDDVLRVAEKYLQPENFVVTVIGDASKLTKQLSDISSIEALKLADYTQNGNTR